MGAVPAKIVIEVEDGNGNTRGDQGEGRRRIDQYDSGDDGKYGDYCHAKLLPVMSTPLLI